MPAFFVVSLVATIASQVSDDAYNLYAARAEALVSTRQHPSIYIPIENRIKNDQIG